MPGNRLAWSVAIVAAGSGCASAATPDESGFDGSAESSSGSGQTSLAGDGAVNRGDSGVGSNESGASKSDAASSLATGDASGSGDAAMGSAGDASMTGADTGNADVNVSNDSGSSNSADSSPSGEGGSSPCSGGQSWLASDANGSGGTTVSGYGEVNFKASTTTQIIELQTTLTVPARPSSSSTLFLWPGLEPLPGGANYNPIGVGVLQPVLTWGTSCAPNSPMNPSAWWISGQYVNPYTSDQAHYGCFGGNVIEVQVGDALDITMSLKGTVWSQVVADRQTGQQSTFDMDLQGQAQDWALFKIEIPTQTVPTSDVVFTGTTLTFAAADPMACQPSVRGTSDYFAAPQSSQDGTKCCISRIILRAQGVAATTPNTP